MLQAAARSCKNCRSVAPGSVLSCAGATPFRLGIFDRRSRRRDGFGGASRMSELATCFEPTPLARGLRPFAKALLLSLAAHAALVAAFWHVVSNPHEPAFPLVR